ncbi:MAG: class I SAM-dependent methyltransferase, partial [Chloroflexota bacterium]
MTWRRVVEGFSETADNYAHSMAPSLRTMAVSVVQRARLREKDRILDAGTGTGIGAAAAMTSGREVVGVDAAPGMLAIARREVPGVRFVEADYGKLPFPAGSFDVVISVHALHFAADPVAVLGEWRRVTTSGGRLSLSVPGPRAALSNRLYDPIYRRHGLLRRVEVPTR